MSIPPVVALPSEDALSEPADADADAAESEPAPLLSLVIPPEVSPPVVPVDGMFIWFYSSRSMSITAVFDLSTCGAPTRVICWVSSSHGMASGKVGHGPSFGTQTMRPSGRV